ncbi:MAG: hypothetical protein LUC95_05735 [Lachnospiraceae bacterium]|nr:hypothetical protein [Lachnospiraceae bacterium]
MLKLMKYELRKTQFSKIVIFTTSIFFEILFLAGIYNSVNLLSAGITGLICCAVFGLIYIGIESLIVLQRDLSTHQSYMLFLTPTNSYQILGAKVIANALTLLIAVCFFGALMTLGVAAVYIRDQGMQTFLEAVSDLERTIDMRITIAVREIILAVVTGLASWIMTIMTGMLAIILSATVFAGRKHSGFVSFLIFLLICWVISAIINLVPEPSGLLYYITDILISLIFAVILYLISCRIMEQRLCV